MAIKKWVVISYCFIFLAIYFCNFAYAFLSTSINEKYNTNLPQTETMNATTSAVSSFSSWQGIGFTVGIAALLIVITFIILGTRSMEAAM